MGNTCCNYTNSPTTDIQVDTETHFTAKKRNRTQNNFDDNYSDTDDDTPNEPIKGKKGIFKRNKKPKVISPDKDESFIESSPEIQPIHNINDTINTNNTNQYTYNNTNKNIADDINNNDSDSYTANINDIGLDDISIGSIDTDQKQSDSETPKQLTHDEELLMLAFRMYTDMDIKDRKWKLKTYKQCFLGNKCVEWLIDNHIVITRNEAVQVGQQLVRQEYICHVEKDHDFKDAHYYYKFMNPIQTFKNVSIKYGTIIQNRLRLKTFSSVHAKRMQFVDELKRKCKRGFAVKDRKYRFKLYPQCFVGEEAVTWMIKNKIAQSRNEAVEMGQLLMNNNVIQHVTRNHKFKDDKKFYEFV